MEKQHAIRELKGIGEKTEALFRKLGISTVEDLLAYYPVGYDIYREPVSFDRLKAGQVMTVEGTVIKGAAAKKVRNLTVVTSAISGEGGQLSLTWFRMTYLKNVLRRGARFLFRGKVVSHNGVLTMEQPKIYTPAQYEQLLHSMQPIYGLTAGLTSHMVGKAVRQALEKKELHGDYLPEEMRTQYELADYNYALEMIHFPTNEEAWRIARRRLVFDEFLFFLLAVKQMKEGTVQTENAFPMEPVWETEEIMENLPYRLTDAQLRTWTEVERDLQGRKPMARLIQGDVGSGKTILAFLAMVMAAKNGWQAALMVPTEVLARQHFQDLEELLARMHFDFCHPVLLTGSTKTRERREAYEAIETGAANLIIGTHALIQEKVVYHRLALVITDEQHRFGVRQREELTKRGAPPHVLVMSATPIPRTLAIILYGDLDISVIDQLPARRLPIKNCVVDTGYRKTAWRFIASQVMTGRQAYVICPMVEESEGMEGENVLDYSKAMAEAYEGKISVGVLHGKMKPAEKNQIMEQFAANEIQVLVSTTVVEVGVNVPNATVMMVENAERFGLAQLHQLRGRVGRGDAQSYCIFVQGAEGEDTKKRLEILNHSNDGFYIAGEDLKLRGPGEFFGVRQSGELEFRIADIYRDADILQTASQAAAQIWSLDEGLCLPQHEKLAAELSKNTSYRLCL